MTIAEQTEAREWKPTARDRREIAVMLAELEREDAYPSLDELKRCGRDHTKRIDDLWLKALRQAREKEKAARGAV